VANIEVGLRRPRTSVGTATSAHTLPPATGVKAGLGTATARSLLTICRLCLVEARPSVLFIFFLRFVVGAAMSTQVLDQARLARTGAGAFVCVLAVFAAYLFNGVMDVHEDRVNGSRRPIASGALSRSVAAGVAAGAAVASVAGALALGEDIAGAVVLILAFGYCYSGPPAYLKRQPLTSAFTGISLVLLTYYAGLAAAGSAHWARPGVLLATFAGGAILWVGLVGSPTKDLSDVAGDVAAGRRTIPAVYGEHAAKRMVAAVALGLAMAFCVLAARVAPLLLWPGAGMLIGASAMAVVCLSGFSVGVRTRRRLPYRVFMTTQYLMHITALLGLTAHFLLSS
jgi:4-hydroxybenzoate polyprenyltransferase